MTRQGGFNRLLIALALLGLAGCAGRGNILTSADNVAAANSATARGGGSFTQALGTEYAEFASSEQAQADYGNADYFAKKSLLAAKGQAVPPESVDRWNIPAQKQSELANARIRLMKALDSGARQSQPVLAAKAQGRYDCWMEQQEENWQIMDIAQCQQQFEAAMNQLEAQAQGPAQPAAVPAAEHKFEVYFNFDRYNLTPEAKRIIDQAAATVKQQPSTHVDVVGKTDTVGSAAYNKRLSDRRAQAVVAELVAQGVPHDRITASGVGKTELPVPTPQGVREARNRVAEITLR